ncbi:MAG: hypothetical protein H6684_16640 [Deltaproteobacteria bacterium]|nr:hypothetical protein [Deltaproteobacteria bacterium]
MRRVATAAILAAILLLVGACWNDSGDDDDDAAASDDDASDDDDTADDDAVGIPELPELPAWPGLEALGEYPRPDLARRDTTFLDGAWEFAYDPDDVGLTEAWQEKTAFALEIQVPFCVESEASGIGDPDPPAVVWYARDFTHENGDGGAVLLHFGAVDYHATVWLNGTLLGEHSGGYTPFSFEIGELLQAENRLVVRVEDGLSTERPRGKQSRTGEPYSVFYETVTGIWQPVWLETAGAAYVTGARVEPNLATGEVAMHLNIAGTNGLTEVFAVADDGGVERVAWAVTDKTRDATTVRLSLRFDELRPWSPDDPHLYPLRLVVRQGEAIDLVESYFGARTIEVVGDDIHLNGEYLYQKLTLNQGYFPQGDYTPVDPDEFRRDIEIVKDFGFNGLRMHQKIEDPRFLFWADYLGALVWEEMPSAWDLTETMAQNLLREWREAIDRDINHPSIVTWVPLNESWGVGFWIAPVILQGKERDFVKYLHAKTKEWDPTRPVIDNSGYDHTSVTDVLDIHQYLSTLDRAEDLYEALLPANLDEFEWSLARILQGITPGGSWQNFFTFGEQYSGQPVLISEYGGYGWYEWEEPGQVVDAYRAATELIQQQPHLDGYCYTQFNDTYQETNGLVDMDRNPLVPVEGIREVNDFDPPWAR